MIRCVNFYQRNIGAARKFYKAVGKHLLFEKTGVDLCFSTSITHSKRLNESTQEVYSLLILYDTEMILDIGWQF